MKKTTNKVVVIGSGSVGTAFLYSAMNQGIAQEFGIIDINKDLGLGNSLDLEDAFPALKSSGEIHFYDDYKSLKDADIVVVTAGRPQRKNETRIDMVVDNAKIMKNIAQKVKKSGFQGITIVASNPVDIMTSVYQEITKFDDKKVISSGTSLDTSRLTLELSKKLNVSPKLIQAYVLGEHGDSSVSTLEYAKIGGVDAKIWFKKSKINAKQIKEMHESVWKKAYEIINRKGSTYFGVGANLANITRAILLNENKIVAVGAKLKGEYGFKDIYFGTPCVINSDGISSILEYPISDKEKEQLLKSGNTIKEVTKKALDSIK